MGFLDFLFKKKEETKEEASGGEEEQKEGLGIPEDAALAMKVGMIQATLTKMDAQLQSLAEIRKSTSERFTTITEQIGEIRGQLMDTNRNMGMIEVKATRAADLVSAVHPDKLMIEVQKEDGKIEALRANIESTEAMMHNIMDQLKKMRSQVAVYRGMEQVIKMSAEIKDEVMNIRKIAATVEQHSDKVESVFADLQKTFREFNTFSDTLNDLKKEVGSNNSKIDGINVKLTQNISKKDFENRVARLESSDKHLKEVLKEIEEHRRKLDKEFDMAKKAILTTFDREFAAAKVMSEGFEKLLIDNPSLAKGLNLKEYIEMRKDEKSLEKELKDADKKSPEKKEEKPAEESKEGEGKEEKK